MVETVIWRADGKVLFLDKKVTRAKSWARAELIVIIKLEHTHAVYIYLYLSMCISISIYIYIYKCIYIHIPIYVYICIYLSLYLWSKMWSGAQMTKSWFLTSGAAARKERAKPSA